MRTKSKETRPITREDMELDSKTQSQDQLELKEEDHELFRFRAIVQPFVA